MDSKVKQSREDLAAIKLIELAIVACVLEPFKEVVLNAFELLIYGGDMFV